MHVQFRRGILVYTVVIIENFPTIGAKFTTGFSISHRGEVKCAMDVGQGVSQSDSLPKSNETMTLGIRVRCI